MKALKTSSKMRQQSFLFCVPRTKSENIKSGLEINPEIFRAKRSLWIFETSLGHSARWSSLPLLRWGERDGLCPMVGVMKRRPWAFSLRNRMERLKRPASLGEYSSPLLTALLFLGGSNFSDRKGLSLQVKRQKRKDCLISQTLRKRLLSNFKLVMKANGAWGSDNRLTASRPQILSENRHGKRCLLFHRRLF